MNAAARTGGHLPEPLLVLENDGVAHVVRANGSGESIRGATSAKAECFGRSARAIVKKLLTSGIQLNSDVWDLALAQRLIANENAALVDEIDSFECPTNAADALMCVKSIRRRVTHTLETSGQLAVLEQIEIPLLPILAQMEIEGIRCDKGKLLAADDAITKRLEAVSLGIHAKAGHSFNIDNSHCLGTVLYEKLKLSDDPPRTRTGLYATDEATLCGLPDHPILNDILEYRRLATLKRSYLNALPHTIRPETGRVHTTFEQLESANGRLVSKNPNLQNIPIASEEGQEIRRAFIPRNEDYLILSADYSQLELRLLAHFSGDKTLLNSFHVGEDVHAITASRIFGVAADAVTDAMRSAAKAINYGIVYGMSAFGLAKRTGRGLKECRGIIESYFERMPLIRKYSDSIVDRARRHGFVSTICGRRRYIPDINHRNLSLRRHSERVAICSPIQGSAADLIKVAMISIQRDLRERNLKTSMLLQVHDELVFDLHRSEQEEVMDLVSEKMRSALPLSVPLEVDIGIGANWLDLN